MKTVYLHVGNFKTGTSAIQKYCSDQRTELLAAGVNYLESARPTGGSASHGCLPLGLYLKFGEFVPDWYSATATFEQVAASVASEIADTSANVLLISSEEFYRLPSLAEDVRHQATEELRQLFGDCVVRVIMYVREPMGFLKSWYNQVNKSALPTARFTDFFCSLDKSLLLPHVNAAFWRECFGDDCLIVRPYDADEQHHVRCFLELVGLRDLEVTPSAMKRVNPGRKESTLERDRIAKIMALPAAEERQWYLVSHAFSSMESAQRLETVIQWVNKIFDTFCSREGLDGMRSEICLGALQVHEEQMNPRQVHSVSGLRSAFYAIQNRPFIIRVKNMLKKFRLRRA
jgi:hypothetical protein